jgi:uncharacterized protein (TIGR02145 family)
MMPTMKVKGILFVILIASLAVSCKKASLPGVTTGTLYGIAQNDAYCSGQVISDGNTTLLERGVCWSTAANPTVKDSKSSDSTGVGLFTSHITGLIPSTSYHVRAYATNSEGTAYGADLSFVTDDITLPTVTTDGLKSLSPTTAGGGGTIISDGGDPITARGLCWSTSPNVTLADNHTTDGTGSGIFYSTITDLVIGTTYYVISYATNSQGTSYGQLTQYVHAEPITDRDGNAYSIITIGTQVWMGENLKTTTFNDGSPIPNITGGIDWTNAVTPAYCWYNNSEPSYKVPYGALYNWYAAHSGKLCPAGWHVPSSEEFTTLASYLGGMGVAGGKMKERGIIHWQTPNTGASNSSGFSGVPGGGRYSVYSQGGAYSDILLYGYHWTSTEGTATTKGISYDLGYSLATLGKDEFPKSDGGSVRCIKDNN